MDQDFHYYGTYYAARQGGFATNDATLIAKAANFVDFFNENEYAAYWALVHDTAPTDNFRVAAIVENPRYTVQYSKAGMAVAPEDGLWCSFHFPPGNYEAPAETPSHEAVHGKAVAAALPGFCQRDTNAGLAAVAAYQASRVPDFNYGKMLNRPQSALSRELIVDTIRCATDESRLVAILDHAAGGRDILDHQREDNLRRLRLILLGLRAHVIADTWAHQDFNGLNSVLNTYWDVDYDPSSWSPLKQGYGRQGIDYNDGTAGWRNRVLSGVSAFVGEHREVLSFIGGIVGTGPVQGISANLEAAPNGTSYLGHGWMGHLPDFSFVKFRYKPCWANPAQPPLERDNPREFRAAWIELVSMFSQAAGKGQLALDAQFDAGLQKAVKAIEEPFDLERRDPARGHSARAWQTAFGDLPADLPDANVEPDPRTVLAGVVRKTDHSDRFGISYINVYSDLYLFQIAADYHFHFVSHYLSQQGIYRFNGSWSQQTSALKGDLSALFAAKAV
ncbi:DUF6765 family protein [Duganella sp. Leaf126]|uniref:DUF6765 family protein n=1 Tax=Duganella sp. Leaf126 TaxID=1736266 RepID=UPI000A56F3FB|nr:DUF6765 family protein [Duganella sp. Leaf126]